MIRKHWKVWLVLSAVLLAIIVGVVWTDRQPTPPISGNTQVTVTPTPSYKAVWPHGNWAANNGTN